MSPSPRSAGARAQPRSSRGPPARTRWSTRSAASAASRSTSHRSASASSSARRRASSPTVPWRSRTCSGRRRPACPSACTTRAAGPLASRPSTEPQRKLNHHVRHVHAVLTGRNLSHPAAARTRGRPVAEAFEIEPQFFERRRSLLEPRAVLLRQLDHQGDQVHLARHRAARQLRLEPLIDEALMRRVLVDQHQRVAVLRHDEVLEHLRPRRAERIAALLGRLDRLVSRARFCQLAEACNRAVLSREAGEGDRAQRGGGGGAGAWGRRAGQRPTAPPRPGPRG